MKTNYLKSMVLLVSLTIIFTSCDSDDPTPPEIAKGEIAILSTLPNADGQSGSTYLQLIGDLTPKDYDNSTALPFNLPDQIVMLGNDIFILPYSGSDLVTKYTRNSNKELEEAGQLTLESNFGPSGIAIQNTTKGYLSSYGRGVIMIFDPSTMTKTGEIDLTSYGVGDENPDPTQMIIRDGKLYVTLNQVVGGFFPAADRIVADVAIINIATDEVEKVITNETSGISQPGGLLDNKHIFMDENNDIYMLCVGAFGAFGHKSGILRIKNGETEFDTDYALTLPDATIEGESNTMSWIHMLQYGGNGKLYGLANIPALGSNPPQFSTDKTSLAIEIDLAAKTVKNLGFPRGTWYGCVGKYNDKIVFGLSTENENGFFTYDMNTKEKSANAIIKTTGFPNLFRHFGEKH